VQTLQQSSQLLRRQRFISRFRKPSRSQQVSQLVVQQDGAQLTVQQSSQLLRRQRFISRFRKPSRSQHDTSQHELHDPPPA
jgi:hypothetical protein